MVAALGEVEELRFEGLKLLVVARDARGGDGFDGGAADSAVTPAGTDLGEQFRDARGVDGALDVSGVHPGLPFEPRLG